MPKISKNIKKLRAEHNLTQDTLAEKIHVTRQAISNWENDKTKPDIEALESLAQAFGVDIEELIYGEKKEVIISQDKTKEKNRIKLILAIVGSLFVASGLALVFFGFWQELSATLQTVFSVIPMLLGQAFAVYTIIKRKNNILWRECAGIIWTVGIVSTIALIDNIYNISWIYTDYLVVDSIFVLPVMFIMGAVTPLIFFYYMVIHIATVCSLFNVVVSMLLFGAGLVFVYLVSRKKEESRSKYVQWVTVIASIPLLIIYAYAGFEAYIFSPHFAVLFTFLISYFLCLFILSPEKDVSKLPYKPISIIGTSVLMLCMSVSGIFDGADVKYEIATFVTSLVVCIIPPVVAGIIKIRSFADNIAKMGIVGLPFVMIIWSYVYAIIDEFYLWRNPESKWFEFSPVVYTISYLIGAILTLGFGVLLVYQGVKELKLLSLNFGVITVSVQIMGIYGWFSNVNILVLGILLATFGIGLIVLNSKMLSMKKSLKIEETGSGDNG